MSSRKVSKVGQQSNVVQDPLSDEGLANLKLYKYSSMDLSPISKNILQPYWSWCVNLFPLWMAPNLITLLGLCFVIVNVILIWMLNPDMDVNSSQAPRWLCFTSAIGLWLYSTFDNVDGKQARRTNSSSPLGELFDHGCDALNCSLGAILQISAMGLGHTWTAALIPAMAVAAFYFSTWEEFYTGTLCLGYINGPTEGLIIACGLMLMSGVYGPGFWLTPLAKYVSPAMLAKFSFTIPVLNKTLLTMTLTDCLAVGMVSLLIFTQIPFSVYNVYRAISVKGAFTQYTTDRHYTAKRSEANMLFFRALLQLTPIFTYFGLAFAWLNGQDSWILWRMAGSRVIINAGGIGGGHLIVFILTLGLVFGRIATKIILAYVTRSQFQMFTFMMAPLAVGAALANSKKLFGQSVFTHERELLYLQCYFLFCLVAYLRWALIVIDRFCTTLGIKCLTIPYAQSSPVRGRSRAASNSSRRKESVGNSSRTQALQQENGSLLNDETPKASKSGKGRARSSSKTRTPSVARKQVKSKAN
ncbi:hypothetical protein MIR68_008453 [Amoeboaphelidium protococcarum]|nr:hypothetical protein MIR68_008453 [Amoeboaphelidium protococcarum]